MYIDDKKILKIFLKYPSPRWITESYESEFFYYSVLGAVTQLLARGEISKQLLNDIKAMRKDFSAGYSFDSPENVAWFDYCRLILAIMEIYAVDKNE